MSSLAAVLVLAATLVGRATPAPEDSVRVWQTDDGLPQNWVSSIAQTRDGYLWIGTRYGGLARFDGVRFVRFTPQNTPGLRDVQVERLAVDEEGTLWIAMGNRSVTALRHGQFTLWRLPRTEPQSRLETTLATAGESVLFTAEAGQVATLDRTRGTAGWTVSKPSPPAAAYAYNIYPADTLHRDHDGRVWYIDQQAQLASLSPAGTPRAPAPPPLGGPVQALATDARGILWIATDRRILSWDGRELRDHTPAGTDLSDVRQIAFSGDGGLWVFGQKGLRKLHQGRWIAAAETEFLRASQSSRHCRLFGDARGGAWIASYGHGVFHARADGTANELTEQNGLPSNLITCWFEDREGNVWIGTAEGGIARIRDRVFQVLGTAQGLPEKMVRTVGVDARGDVWAGTMSGQLARWRDGACSVVPLPAVDATPMGGITVWPSQTGAIWIGGVYHGLMRLEEEHVARTFTTGDSWLIRVLFEDSRHALWIGARGELRRYTDGKMESFGPPQGFQGSVTIGAITEDPSGAVWIGTAGGDLWRHQDGTFTHFRPPDDWPRAQVVSLVAGHDGVIWMATLGNGLLRFHGGRFARIRTAQGLPDDNIPQLLADREGDLWAGTYAGIFRVKQRDLEEVAAGRATSVVCSSYGRPEGLPALECTTGFNPACWRAPDGRLWFCTVNGLVSVDPSAVPLNPHPPEVVIEELHVDGEPRGLPHVGAAQLEIEPGRHFLQFRFTGLSFGAPDKVRFRWKLHGVDRDWQDSGTQRVIGCGPLSPGEYRLEVRACNADGVWGATGATLSFHVRPYFWETWWFKVLAVVAAVAAVSGLVLLRLRRRYRETLERLRREHEVERERARIARDLHDDLGTSLTQISMLSALANRAQTSVPETKEIIQQVHGRARDMVTALDEIVWAVNPKNDSWPELANYLAQFAQEFFRPTGIRCRLDIPVDLPVQPVSAELRHHLFLGFKEAINNAAKHSGASEVSVAVEISEGEMIVSVKDDGRGVSPTPRPGRQGNGLVNMQRRLEAFGGRTEISSAAGAGTTVSFHVPLGGSR